jgi:YfiH family protein
MGPAQRSGYWLWSDSQMGVEVRFAGRGPVASRAAVLGALEGQPIAVRWAKQVHGRAVLPIAGEDRALESGPSGEGDALVTAATGIALAIATADCVPVLLAVPGAIAAAHAGWRGVVAGVVPAAIVALRARAGGPSAPVRAWLGPSIGACCYEVGEEVADAVAGASSPAVVHSCASARPHVDVAAAVRHQLGAAGVETIREATACTRCSEQWLWSYRRDGGQAGRNLAFIWRPAA